MNINETNSEKDDSDTEEKGRFQHSVEHIKTIWKNFKTESKTAKFWLELFALIGLGAYTGVALLQWHATTQTMRLDQRPWVAPKGGQLQLQIGQAIARPIFLQNTGKTAALHVQGIFRMEVVKEGDEPTFDYSPPHASKMSTPVLWQGEAAPIPPVTLLILKAPTEPLLFSRELNERYNNRTIMFIEYGRVTYDDIWGIHHLTTACQSQIAPDPSGVIYMLSKAELQCTEYTSVDTNY
jgi:hypothetical protein